MNLNWIYLFLAGLFEIGWPVGLKMGNVATSNKLLWIILAVISMAISGILLLLAQRTIPMGTAYAIWTGIGAVGTFFVGIIWFNDSASLMRMLSVSFIIIGIIGLKLSSNH